VVLADGGAVGGVDIRGSATGSQELDVLSPHHVTPQIHGICLAGGSAFGLESASGVRNYLERKGVGFETRAAKVPIIPAAILYDLEIGKSVVRPTREMGEAAAKAAGTDTVAEGNVGAGTGATVGKLRGIKNAMKGGVGSFTVRLGSNILVSALVVTNSFGDVIEPKTGKVVAGARKAPDSSEFVDATQAIRQGERLSLPAAGHTILGVIATNVRLTKAQASKLAALAQHGMVRTVSPVHTIYDGDIVFALSLGSETADFMSLGVAAADALSAAILRSVQTARTLGGVPGLLNETVR
jgi:L-aminopeptidase/D-esterase-like protein